MAADPPFGGGIFIADKSAWKRAQHPLVAEEWRRAIVREQIATTAIVKIELLYSARSADDFEELAQQLAALRDIPVTRSVTDAALAAMRNLAHRQPLYHRIPPPDVLVAAAAQDVGLGVLHYDRHYERLAEVLDFDSRWLGAPGSLS